MKTLSARGAGVGCGSNPVLGRFRAWRELGGGVREIGRAIRGRTEVLGGHMDGLLILISMAAGTVAFIALIRPLPRFWLPTRKRAAIAWVASFVLLFIGGSLLPVSISETPPEVLVGQEVTDMEVASNREEGAEVGGVLLANAERQVQASDKAAEKILARWEPSPEMAKTLRLPFFEKATLTYRAGKMILVSQYGDGGRMERVLVERPAGDAAERKFDLQTQDRPEYFTLSGTGVVRYFSWEGREFKTASVSFIDPDAMNIGNNVQQRPCIPTKLSPAAMELVRLYDQLHAFKDDPEFIRVGFAGGPYSAWLQAIERHRNTNSGLELLDELGFTPSAVLNLGMNYIGENLSESDLSFIEASERKIQAGLALTRCTELGSEWQEIVQASSEARQSYLAEAEAQILALESLLGRPLTDEELADVEFEKLRGVLEAGTDAARAALAELQPLTDRMRAFRDQRIPEHGAALARAVAAAGAAERGQGTYTASLAAVETYVTLAAVIEAEISALVTELAAVEATAPAKVSAVAATARMGMEQALAQITPSLAVLRDLLETQRAMVAELEQLENMGK